MKSIRCTLSDIINRVTVFLYNFISLPLFFIKKRSLVNYTVHIIRYHRFIFVRILSMDNFSLFLNFYRYSKLYSFENFSHKTTKRSKKSFNNYSLYRLGLIFFFRIRIKLFNKVDLFQTSVIESSVEKYK